MRTPKNMKQVLRALNVRDLSEISPQDISTLTDVLQKVNHPLRYEILNNLPQILTLAQPLANALGREIENAVDIRLEEKRTKNQILQQITDALTQALREGNLSAYERQDIVFGLIHLADLASEDKKTFSWLGALGWGALGLGGGLTAASLMDKFRKKH